MSEMDLSSNNVRGRIFGIKRFAIHDGDGIRTTVFFKGCPLRCVWCHNPEGIAFSSEIAFHAHKCVGCGECLACPEGAMSLVNGIAEIDREKCAACGKCEGMCAFSAREYYGRETDVISLADELCADAPFFVAGGGGVTLSGGECLSQAEFATMLLKELKKRGIHTAVDTCGCVPLETFERVIPYTDVFLYDIKAIDSETHKKCTGRDNSLILSNLVKLCGRGCKVEVRIPLVVGYNDGEIAKIGEFLNGKGVGKVTVLKYHDLARSKYVSLHKTDTMPMPLTTNEDVARAVELLRSYGLNAIKGKDD